jgi:hypothetical protein
MVAQDIYQNLRPKFVVAALLARMSDVLVFQSL